MSQQHMHHWVQNSNDKNITDTFPLPASGTIEQVIAMTAVDDDSPDDSPSEYNYAEALQKSISFYEAQKAGPGVTGGHIIWRGD